MGANVLEPCGSERSLMKNLSDLDDKESEVCVKLMMACIHGDEAEAREALASGASPAVVDPDLRDALMLAAMHGSAPCARMLLPDSDLLARDYYGMSALALAARRGHAEAVDELAPWQDIDGVAKGGQTPLMWAASEGNYECAMALLGAGAKTDATDELGWTALHHAAWFGCAKMAKALIRKSPFELKALDNEGRDPRSIAMRHKACAVTRAFAMDGASWAKIERLELLGAVGNGSAGSRSKFIRI